MNIYLGRKREKRDRGETDCLLEGTITNEWNSCVNLRKTFLVGLLNALRFFCNVFLALFIVFSGIISFSQLLYICTCFWYVKSFILWHEPLVHSISVPCFFQCPSSSIYSHFQLACELMPVNLRWCLHVILPAYMSPSWMRKKKRTHPEINNSTFII